MKNVRILLPVCSLLCLLASCMKEHEVHQLSPIEQSLVLFADETTDSVTFYTFDSWTATPQDDWIFIDGDSHIDFKYDYTKRYLCRVTLAVKPNTTGKTRVGSVLVESYEYSFTAPLIQLGLLNVSHPEYTVDDWLDEKNRVPNIAHYELTDSAHWTSDSICFYVQKGWEIKFEGGTEPDWLKLDSKDGNRGRNCVYLTLTPNTDKENGRKATLSLISSGVTNKITVVQLPAKEQDAVFVEEEE